MFQSDHPTMVLLVGGTGTLGARTAHHLLAQGADLRLLVRDIPSSAQQKALSLNAIARAGATIVRGDLGDAAALDAATTGIDVVVSTVQGGPDVIVEGQVMGATALTSPCTFPKVNLWLRRPGAGATRCSTV